MPFRVGASIPLLTGTLDSDRIGFVTAMSGQARALSKELQKAHCSMRGETVLLGA